MRHRDSASGKTGRKTNPQTNPLRLFSCFSVFLSPLLVLAVLVSVFLAGGAEAQQTETQAGTQTGTQAGTMTVEADHELEWRRDEGVYFARGNAVVTTPEATLRADEITATATAGTSRLASISGKGEARIDYDGATGTADRIDYNRLDDTLRLIGAAVRIVRAGDVITASESVSYNRATGIITARGSAMITLADGRSLAGEAVTVTLAEDRRHIATAVSEGNAEIVYPVDGAHRIATARRARYDAATEIVTLTEEVSIVDGDNSMSGDRAVIDLAEGVAVMSSSGADSRISGQFLLDR